MKARKLFLIAFFSIFGGIQEGFSQLDVGRLLYYPMNASADDLSGNGFNSTDFTNSFGPDRFGNPNSAFAGNGIDTYFDLPDEPALKPPLPITVAFFINFNSTAANQTGIFTLDFAQNNHSGLWMNLNSFGGMTINYGGAIFNANASNRNSKGGDTNIQTGVWYCVVAIARGFNDMDIYIDGVNDGGGYSGTMTAMAYTDALGSIGRKDNDPPPYYLNGSIDEFMLWDRELTIDEIASYCNIGQTYSANVEVACPGETTSLEIVGITDPSTIVSVNWEIDGVGDFTGTPVELDNLVSGFYTYSAVVETSDGQTQNIQGSFTIPGMPDVSNTNLPDQLSLCGVAQVSISFADVFADWDQVLDPDGIAIQDYTFTSPGVYAFTFVHTCGEEIFEVEVSADFVLPNIGLPADACIGEPVTAELTFPIGSQVDVLVDWGDGTTEIVDGNIVLSHVYNSLGTFDILISGNVDGCALDANETILVGILPEFELESSAILCAGETYIIEFLPQGFDVLGPNGNEITSFQTNTPGSYTFTAQNACGSVTQTLELTFLEINPQQIIYNPNICPEQDTLVIGFTDPAFTYLWTNTSTSSSISVSTPGNYQVQVSLDGCSETFNFGIVELAPLDLSLFPDDDVVVCSEGDRMLILPNLGVPFTFSDGSQGFTYLVESSETLEVSFTDGCYAYNKAVDIELIDCLCPLFVPNAFTPDEDGLNDIFKPVVDCPVEDYHLRIFNRLGTLIFESRDIHFGWNGRSPNNNYYAENELYLYHIIYAQRLDGLLNPIELSGHLTLLR